MASVRVVLRGSADLTKFPIPQSWLGRFSVTHSKDYNISEKELDSVKRRVTQEGYNSKNPEREMERVPIEDSFVESEWFRVGTKNGNYGEYWNPSKLAKIQEFNENNLFVPQDYVAMKTVKTLLGVRCTREKVEEAGYDLQFGRKKGNRGSSGWFVEPDIMNCRASASTNDGVVPAGQVFTQFPNLSDIDIADIVDNNEEGRRVKKFKNIDQSVSRRDLMVSVKPLEELNAGKNNSTKQLRSRSITSADVVENSAKLRKMLRSQNKKKT